MNLTRIESFFWGRSGTAGVGRMEALARLLELEPDRETGAAVDLCASRRGSRVSEANRLAMSGEFKVGWNKNIWDLNY